MKKLFLPLGVVSIAIAATRLHKGLSEALSRLAQAMMEH